MKSYKDENEHWLSQLNDMQREHMDLRTRLAEQKTVYLKQLSDKDTQIEQLRLIINNLRVCWFNYFTLQLLYSACIFIKRKREYTRQNQFREMKSTILKNKIMQKIFA